MKPNFEPTDPNQYNIGFTRGEHHPFEPSTESVVSTTESVTEELPPHLQPPTLPHQQNVMEHMQQPTHLMNTENPVTYTWTFNLEDCQVNITISNYDSHKYKFSINNITNCDNFVVNVVNVVNRGEFRQFKVEGQGPYNKGFDFTNEIYLYRCTAYDTTHPTISPVLPHVYKCPFKSCGLGVNCHNQTKGHRGYCTHYGRFHYPQHGQLIYKFDCNVAREICDNYNTLNQNNLPNCPLTLFYHQ